MFPIKTIAVFLGPGIISLIKHLIHTPRINLEETKLIFLATSSPSLFWFSLKNGKALGTRLFFFGTHTSISHCVAIFISYLYFPAFTPCPRRVTSRLLISPKSERSELQCMRSRSERASDDVLRSTCFA